MYIEDTTFTEGIIREQYVGAGIIPIAWTVSGIKMLLGRERHVNHWKGSCKWSGFEGGRKPNESIERTAAREFFEESLGQIELFNTPNTIDDVERSLMNGKYFSRIVLCITNGSAQRRYHVTFLVEVPDQVVCFTKFKNLKRGLSVLSDLCNHYKHLEEQIAFNESFLQEGVRNVSALENAALNTCNKHHSIQVHSSEGTQNISESGICKTKNALLYKALYDLRLQIEHVVNALPCNTCVVAHLNSDNRVVSATISDDFLEKDTLMWWTLPNLKTALLNGGTLRDEAFRAFFLPVLQKSIEQLDVYEKMSRPYLNKLHSRLRED